MIQLSSEEPKTAKQPPGQAALMPLVMASFAPTSMLLVRIAYSRHLTYMFLFSNLLLAWMPLLLAWLTWRSRQHMMRALTTGFLWLLYLPNAPYLITDLIHLKPTSEVPLWYDAGMLFSFAFVGMMLGLTSLLTVQGLVIQRFGFAAGWIFALAISMLSSFGIYIGRFLRWNSWELLLHPVQLASDVLVALSTPASALRLLIIVLLFGSVTFVGLLMIPAYQRVRFISVERL